MLYEGVLLGAEMAHERVTRAEVISALRAAGLSRLSDARCVVLETNGQVSVIPRGGPDDQGTSRDDGLLMGVDPGDLAGAARKETTKQT